MEIIVKCYGTLVSNQQKVLRLSVGNSLTFDYLDEKIVVKVEELNNDFYVVSLNRNFCLDNLGTINLNQTSNIFKFPYEDKSIIALPLYDATCKLEFLALGEEN